MEENLLNPKVEKYVKDLKKNKNYNSEYINIKSIKNKVKNSKELINVKSVKDDGLIELKTGDLACVMEINAVDLSLSSRREKDTFFYYFKDIFKIKNLKLKCVKLDKRINLNLNKENYEELIKRFSDDEFRLKLLNQNLSLINELESENYTLASSYYFILIAKDIETMNRQIEEIEVITNSLVPKMYVEVYNNKLEVYNFLCNFYLTNASLDQLMYLDLPELIVPSYFEEKSNMLKFDDKDIQLVTIKKIPPFIDELFLDNIFNMPNVRACLNITDSVDTDILIRRLDRNYGSLLSDRSTSRKLSDVTEMDTEKENYQILMNDIKNGNEVVKNVSLILIIYGTQKEREEVFLELKRLAENNFQLKLEIPKLRQLEAWKCYDITGYEFTDYVDELPTRTIAASFPFTQTNFNDYNGYITGYDIHSDLPVFFDMFYLNKKSRTSHNVAIVSTTGGGKSFTIKKLLVNEYARGTKIFILDPEGEYEKLVRNNNGEYIDLYSKKNGIINPLQIRYIPNDGDDKNIDYPLPKHLGFLESFFKSAFDDISEKELITLLIIIEKLYNKKGIYSNTRIEDLEKLSNRDYPIFSDLLKYIPEYKKEETSPEKIKVINQLEIIISRFLTGTDSYLFDGYTTIDLSNDLIAFNMKDLLYSDNKRLINTQTINLLTYLSNAVVSNKINNDKLDKKYKKPICIVADEFHLFINEDNCEILRNFGQLARRIRKYKGSLIVATQSIEDFVGSADILRHAKAIFNNCQYQLIGMMKEADMLAYLELFKENPLTDTQKSFLLKANQGEFLFNITRKNRLRVKISATPLEIEMMGEET